MSIRKLQLGALLVLLCVVGVFSAAAQQTKTPKPAPTPKKEKEKEEWKYEPPPREPLPMPPGRPTYAWEKTQTSEKSIDVSSDVNIKLCVANQSGPGELKINGWERNEVRIFVRSGRLPGFKVLEKDEKSGKPNWIYITNVAPEGSRPGFRPECLAGADIEIDVPMGAAVDLTGRSADSVIDSIRKVKIDMNEGDVQIRNIAGGINATTYNGNLNVESSEGQIMLATTSGNILAFGVNQGRVGDLFKAKSSSGSVILQQVEHRQIEASSISGTINFKGKLLAGGLYSFKTSSGPIRLLIPLKSSFMLKAAYGFGGFNSELPMKIESENKIEGGANVTARIGTGDSSVNLTTSQGSILLKKQL